MQCDKLSRLSLQSLLPQSVRSAEPTSLLWYSYNYGSKILWVHVHSLKLTFWEIFCKDRLFHYSSLQRYDYCCSHLLHLSLKELIDSINPTISLCYFIDFCRKCCACTMKFQSRDSFVKIECLTICLCVDKIITTVTFALKKRKYRQWKTH